ncbi:MAG: hypothetical protein ABI359_03065 [Ginsengibacter sp.]
MKDNIYDFKFWQLWTVIALLYLIFSILSNTYIFTNNFYYKSFSDKFTIERIAEMISFQRKFQNIGYLLISVVLLIKVSLIAGVIFMGTFLISQNISYQNCLKIALIAELVSFIGVLIRTAWLLIHRPDTAQAIQYFSPFSISQLFNIDKIPKYLIYPLQLFNIFELAYWLVLAFGIMTFSEMKFPKSIKVVAGSYGVALFIWTVFIVFIQVQFT